MERIIYFKTKIKFDLICLRLYYNGVNVERGVLILKREQIDMRKDN